jgi:hypothetical protein
MLRIAVNHSVSAKARFQLPGLDLKITKPALVVKMQVGERLVVNDKDGAHSCTVRYIGTVDGKEGTWVGVEWDVASRGKNDGTVSGKRYFACLHNKIAGSLIRYEKIKPGISLVQAVSQRYTLGDSDLKDMTIQAGKRTMAVDLTGIGKVSQHLKQLNLITSMTIHEAKIARAVCTKAGSWTFDHLLSLQILCMRASLGSSL